MLVFFRARIFCLLSGLLFTSLLALPVLAADSVRVRGGVHSDFSRIVFDWPADVGYEARIENNAIVISFDRAGNFKARHALNVLGDVIEAPIVSEDGTKITIPLSQPYEVKHFPLSKRIVVDLFPKTSQPSSIANADQHTGRPKKAPAPETATPAETATQAEEVQTDEGEASASPVNLSEAEAAPIPPNANAPLPLFPVTPDNGEAKQVSEDPSLAADVNSSTGEVPAALPQAEVVPVELGPVELGEVPSSPHRSGPTPRRARGRFGSLEILPREIDLDEDALPLGSIPDAPIPVALRFTWQSPPPAAAFRYGGEIWLVFDRPLPGGQDQVLEEADLGFDKVRQITSAHGTALIFSVSKPHIAVQLRREEHGWLADFRPRSELPQISLESEVLALGDRAVLRFAHKEAGRIHWLADEVRGERLAVVPIGEEGVGINITSTYPQFQTLQTQQGFVLRPMSEGVEVAVTPNGALVRHRDGLIVSSSETRDLLPRDSSRRDIGRRLFFLGKWRRGDREGFAENKHRLIQAAIKASEDQRVLKHLELARFYFAWGLGTETIGLLDLIEDEAPERASDPEFRLMRAASSFMIEDFETAGRLLGDPILAGESEALLWRSAYSAVLQNWQAAASGFAETDGLIASYAPRVRNDLLIWAAESRLGVGDVGGTSEYLIALSRFDMNASEEARAKYLTALRFFMGGERELAFRLWRDLEDDPHPASRARAKLALLDAQMEEGTLDNAKAIEILEKLRFTWRGDNFERALMVRLAGLYEGERRYREALTTLQLIATHFPEFDRVGQVSQKMRDTFVKLFDDVDGQTVPPVETLALFELFRELTPAGEAGARIAIRLADRLVEVDLLQQASELLNNQLRYHLEGADKTRVASKLALVNIMNRDPEGALEALDISDTPDFNEETRRERAQLRAKALAMQNKHSEALAALGDDDNGEALLLRAEILWEMEDWRAAARALERLVPPVPGEGLLATEMAGRVMNLTIALTMAGDQVRLMDLFKRYGGHMAETEHASAFHLLAGEVNPKGPESIAEGLKQVDHVKDFYQDYSARP